MAALSESLAFRPWSSEVRERSRFVVKERRSGCGGGWKVVVRWFGVEFVEKERRRVEVVVGGS